ncbi:MAG: YqiJ family protein [Pseudomonadota bacterium]
MIETFFSPATTSFAVAICLMLLIAVFEVIGALFGLSPSSALDDLLPEVDTGLDADFDADFDADIDAVVDLEVDGPDVNVTGGGGGALDGDAPAVPNPESVGPLSQVLGWLCVGRVPILVLLIVFLTSFGMVGFFVQGLMRGIFGFALPEIVAVVPALAGAFPATRFAGLTLGKLIPKEQTEAVSRAHFVGRVATITSGEAQRGLAAEAKLTDRFGQTHYIRVEPDDDAERFAQGTDVIVVRQSGSIFYAILNTSAAMTD